MPKKMEPPEFCKNCKHIRYHIDITMKVHTISCKKSCSILWGRFSCIFKDRNDYWEIL